MESVPSIEVVPFSGGTVPFSGGPVPFSGGPVPFSGGPVPFSGVLFQLLYYLITDLTGTFTSTLRHEPLPTIALVISSFFFVIKFIK